MPIVSRLFAGLSLLCFIASPAMAQKTKATLNTEISVNFPDNMVGFITPALARPTLMDIINSIMPTAPVVSGNLACFNGTTGLLQDCGVVPVPSVTCPASQWFNSLIAGVLNCSQPAITNLSGLGTGVATAAAIVVNTSGGFATIGGGSEVSSFNARSGAVIPAIGDYTLNQIYNCTMLPQGRLTFLTGTPVQIATTSGASSHFYTPYLGQQVPIYDGTRFSCVDTGGELTQTAADTTKSPTAVANNSCYDVFVWSDSGTIRATRGKVWTNVTTRADALQRIKGILTNGTAITNGPGLNLGTYVGTECSNGTATFDWIFGTAASGGTAASLNAWNQYNRVDVTTNVIDNGVGYAYASATIRQARASAGNQISFVSGNAEDGILSTYDAFATTPATAANGVIMGIGLDSTSSYNCQASSIFAATAVATSGGITNACTFPAQAGRHVISANESDSSTGSGTFDNQNALNSLGSNNTLSFKFRM